MFDIAPVYPYKINFLGPFRPVVINLLSTPPNMKKYHIFKQVASICKYAGGNGSRHGRLDA
jgi:hypothetical protein